MKRNKIGMIIFSLNTMFLPWVAQAQHEVPNGGTPAGELVSAVINDILIQADHSKSFQEMINYTEFKNKVLRTQIKKVASLATCMANYPGENRIEVTEACWASLETYKQKKRLVLHELLGVTSNEGSETYTLTDRLIGYVSCNVEIKGKSWDKNNRNRLEKALLRKKGYYLFPVQSFGIKPDFLFQSHAGGASNRGGQIGGGGTLSALILTLSDTEGEKIWSKTSFSWLGGYTFLIRKGFRQIPESACKE